METQGIVDSGAMENWDGTEEQFLLIYEEVKDILWDYPELTTSQELGDQWMEEYASPNLIGITKITVPRWRGWVNQASINPEKDLSQNDR